MERIEVAELGGSLWFREMTAGERDRYDIQQYKDPDHHRRTRLIACTACDETGALLFNECDLVALDRMPSWMADRLAAVAARVNCLTTEDVEALREQLSEPGGRFLYRLVRALGKSSRKSRPSPASSSTAGRPITPSSRCRTRRGSGRRSARRWPP